MTNENNHEQWSYLSLTEVTHSFGVTSTTIMEIIDEGIVSLEKDTKNEWQFDDKALRRIRMALRLTNDLGVNLAGAGLALELLDEIDQLRMDLLMTNMVKLKT
jgi:chaperone modulatory protein CbpM